MTTTAITYAEQERLEHIIGMIEFGRANQVNAVEIETAEWLLTLIRRLDEGVKRARKALNAVLACIDDQVFVRNITNDDHFPSFVAQGSRIVAVLKAAQDALDASVEFCRDCGVQQSIVWHADDAAWVKVIGGGVVCPPCFDARAKGKWEA